MSYTYNVALRDVGNIFRYDSPHLTHNQFHHVHRYEPLEEGTDATLSKVPEEEWPRLDEVIEEAANWYYDHLDQLSEL